ncbi:MAG: UDP-3-O-(3-hydroxymyristoyl)glucosamine N-acyltransferase [Pantoea sp. Brub]|nr:UDP-3-O-(3-hydroxymyristoyl)glucosamine N-acyltransferase [Pantoea sp. Brub]
MLSIRLIDLAKMINADLYGDGNILISGIAAIQSAKHEHITFLTNNVYRKYLTTTKASAVIIMKSDLKFCKIAALIVKDPYVAYAYVAHFFNTKSTQTQSSIANTAIIHNNTLGKNVSIGEYSVIEKGVTISDNVIVGSGCFIGENTYVGHNTRIFANVSVHHKVIIGKNCSIQSGSVIGSDGFGFIRHDGNWIKIPQLGTVIIGNNVEIGASTTIDRGALDNTIIGDDVIIDNLCHIAHNVIIGNHTAIAGGVIMAGSLHVGSYCKIGGASVINGHIQICDNVSVTGMSMVMRSINKPGIYSSGIPLQDNKTWRKNTVLLMHINDINKRLKCIEQHSQNIQCNKIKQ